MTGIIKIPGTAITFANIFTSMQRYQRWARWALLNLVIVSAAGVILRYKILFPLPAVDHKNLLHAHSHFAFSGWVSLALFTAITAILAQYKSIKLSSYTRLFRLGQIAAFGMLFTFPFMGYKAPSIAFSTLSIVFSYVFAYYAWKDMRQSALSKTTACWFKAALVFYVISSLGAFNLAWLMASKTGSQPLYIGSIYFFLHFQYNGWFSFAILGLLFYQLEKWSVRVNNKRVMVIFWLLLGACFPAFLLSALWMQLPVWLHGIAVVAALVQLAALALLGKLLWAFRQQMRQHLQPAVCLLWLLAFAAFSIKIILQTLSTIPSLSYLAFGFRPIVIGYLHLILLTFVTFFLLGYLLQQRMLSGISTLSRSGLTFFGTGVILNELFLFLQGLAAIGNTGWPFLNYFLLLAAVIMFGGLLTFFAGQWRSQAAVVSV